MNGIYQDCDQFWKFSNSYISSLTSYGLITGLADFHFTEQCYWYFQSTLNPCLKAAPLSVEKPDLTNIILFLQSFFHLSSLRQVIPVLSEPYELVPSQFFSTWVADVQQQGQKKQQYYVYTDIFGAHPLSYSPMNNPDLVYTFCARS